MDDRGRGLLGGYWGGYVVVHVGPDDVVRIFRDPSGLLPCYFRIGAEGVALGGSILNLAAPGPDAVDFPELACILAGGDLRGRKTCLAGVEELIAGECLVFDRGRATTEPWWSPWDHVGGSGIGSEDAVTMLRKTVSDCVRAWADAFPSLLVGVSGGLDSSIVTTAAAVSDARLICLNLVSPDFDGDERRYARALTTHLGLDLVEAHRDIADIDVTRSAAPLHPWPFAPLYKQTNEAIHRRLLSAEPFDAFFTGNGGDGIFFGTRSAIPLVDRLLADGPRPSVASTVGDISTLTGADARTVLKHAWARYRRNGGRHAPGYNVSGLNPKMAGRIKRRGATHPWLKAPDWVLPGKTVHAAYLMRAQKGVELYDRAARPPHIAPLMSQPIVELCLAIPSWHWIAGGRNRAVARSAFEPLLPALVSARTQKGGPGNFHLSIYRQHRGVLHQRLREGVLVSSGLLDPSFLDGPDDPTWRGAERIDRILAFSAAENWARYWSGVG
ncbi:MAG: asparagine synthase-related protein [Sphingopyxis sp.]|uniref:asparagine synthase-related protein n=1 Tax=Sphingopyxis sp. TaxID=1908224 RepID=UPI003D6D5A6B